MRKINWIHFSDLHLGDDCAVDTRLMRKTLPSYIASLNRKFDYAFCTGDIKNWSSDYTSAPGYLTKILNASRTRPERLFIVPGNHDISICPSGDSDRDKLIDKVTDWNSSYYESDEGVLNDSDLSLLRSGEDDFISFIKDFLGEKRAAYYSRPHFVITTRDFNILHVDSALTYNRTHGRDFILGTGGLLDALEQCDESKPTILLTHYSFDFLEQQERNEVEKLLSTYNVQLWLAGHEHENLIRWQREKFLECQTGNLALQKGARSCFLTAEYDLDTGEGVIKVHAWYPGKGWECYPFARIGTSQDDIFPFALRLPGDNRASDLSAELANAREAVELLTHIGNVFSGVNIDEGILTDLELGGKTFRNGEKGDALDQVIEHLWHEEETNALIVGDGGMGKSTAMFHACESFLGKNKLAVYVSLQARESADNESITDFILRCLYKSIDERAKSKFVNLVISKHTHQDLVLFIDGFNELTGEGAQRYVSEIKSLSQYPGIQIIISSRLNFLRDYGLSHFGMIQTCDLREAQIKSLFSERQSDWNSILAQKNLRILLRNPMMALLYSSTCPIIERNADVPYLSWIQPITNASDLLHDYYMSQIAILIEKNSFNSKQIFNSALAIDQILSIMAYSAERGNRLSIKEVDFDTNLERTVDRFNRYYFEENHPLPIKFRQLERKLRYYPDHINENELYEAIIKELCLLRSGNNQVSFAHQIFRDYLAAVYLHNSLIENISVNDLWHKQKISDGIIEYLRFIGTEATWGSGGTVSQMLQPYRGVEAQGYDYFIDNVLSCWLSTGYGERDLSGLDLRHVSLSKQLKNHFTGTINIDNAWISKDTLINDKCHDKIIGIAFSHDNRTLAAVSENGIVSITNLITQSQMIIGQLEPDHHVTIGFDADDFLIIQNSVKTYKWPTITYDKTINGNVDDILTLNNADDGTQKKIKNLYSLLKESDLEGICQKASDNGRFLAVGFDSGFIQIWDTSTQDCIAELSLSDTQIATAAFTKDGRLGAFGSGGKIVQIWDIARGECTAILYFDQRVSKVLLPGDGEILQCKFSDGTYREVNIISGEIGRIEEPDSKPFVSRTLHKQITSMSVADIKTAANGNAILVTNKGEAYTWDESLKRLNLCKGHMSKVTATAICASDNRFAASYSPEKYRADRDDKSRRRELDDQKLVRTRIIKTGQCQFRIPTKGRSIRKLQYFTSNRIVLAGYATNGDIMLWELINTPFYGRERGEWKVIDVIKNNQAEPLECAFPSNKDIFISAYTDGSIVIRPFADNHKGIRKRIETLPGIDAGVFRWKNIKCDDELRRALEGYEH